MTDTVKAMFEKFDVVLIEDELVSRGVFASDAARITASGSAIFRSYVTGRNINLGDLYLSVKERADLKQRIRKEKSTANLLRVPSDDKSSGDEQIAPTSQRKAKKQIVETDKEK
jgi:hypothetical protein